MLQFLGAAITNPGLGLLFAVIGGISMWALEALFYIRMILLYVYLPVRIADCICTGLRKHSGRIRYRDGVLQTVCPVGRPPAPRCDGPQGYDLIYAGGAHARNSVPQISCRCVPPAGRTLHHVEDVQIRDPVDGQSRRRCDERRSPRWRCRRRGLRRWRRRRDDRRSVGAKSRRWPRRRAKAAARGGHGADDSGAPSYRRTENDPGGATAESTSDGRGMDFDRGIH